ncbi:hypothetical protein RF11_00904 [Thelohanellus kitauei]|uniref:Uncharacterized protein n=1 Tax=Thelohanellus kitauei TaxID=669202 RepID=A0A0C2J8Y3_THEKT|nr:hypothetical protein RF11_00904 [Thelohanellus kitauei]
MAAWWSEYSNYTIRYRNFYSFIINTRKDFKIGATLYQIQKTSGNNTIDVDIDFYLYIEIPEIGVDIGYNAARIKKIDYTDEILIVHFRDLDSKNKLVAKCKIVTSETDTSIDKCNTTLKMSNGIQYHILMTGGIILPKKTKFQFMDNPIVDFQFVDRVGKILLFIDEFSTTTQKYDHVIKYNSTTYRPCRPLQSTEITYECGFYGPRNDVSEIKKKIISDFFLFIFALCLFLSLRINLTTLAAGILTKHQQFIKFIKSNLVDVIIWF